MLRELLALALCAGTACAPSIRRFPLAEPMLVDPDRQPFLPKPEEHWAPMGWDAADYTVFRPLSRSLLLVPGRPAINVNAHDEVPNSSWFENRIGLGGMTPDEVAEGPCNGASPRPPWTVVSGKSGGANPGFIIADAEDHRWLLKLDGSTQPERRSTAETIGSRLYFAAGFHAPCNVVVYFDRAQLSLGSSAEIKVRRVRRPMTREDVDAALEEAVPGPGATLRGLASLFLPGTPLGPWRYEGTREDDPNDVVPHEHRRELRAAYVLASWINHFDHREHNTLASWIEARDGRGHVMHNFLDWGDSLGSLWENDALARRLGHSNYLDLAHVAEDFFTLGTRLRPWERLSFGPTGMFLGYFGAEHFTPDAWKPGYPNPAFEEVTEEDAAWMARIVAHFSDDHVRAIVDRASISVSTWHAELLRTMLARRDAILRRWLGRLSPLAHPRTAKVGPHTELCLRDLAVDAQIAKATERRYWVVAARPSQEGGVVRKSGAVCLVLPRLREMPELYPLYSVLEIHSTGGLSDVDQVLRVHLYQLASGEYRVAGLERPRPS